MNKTGIWQISGGKLKRIQESDIKLEKYLEDWIEEDPSLIRAGLTIIGRQINLEGGILDLLAIDHQGCWTIIEIKRGTLHRETVAQVLDYASCIATIPGDELRDKIEPYLKEKNLNLDELLKQREALSSLEPDQRQLAMVLVGTGRAPGIDRITQFLADSYGLPITVVDFDVFNLDDQKQILSREITERETFEPKRSRNTSGTIDEVFELAKQYGTADILRKCIDTANNFGLYARPWKTSIMFAPPKNRTRALFTVWIKPEHEKIKLWIGNEPFSEFYSISEETVKSHIGDEGFQYKSRDGMKDFFKELNSLYEEIQFIGSEKEFINENSYED